jgi:hypothetical protein
VNGLFGPVDPTRPSGFGAAIVAAEPVLIHAPVAVVWRVIAGFEDYPLWNPLNRTFACAGHVGAAARFGVSWGPYDGRLRDATFTMDEVVTVWEPERCFAYADDRGRLHRAERVQLLTATPEGTRYHTFERWAGALSPVIAALYTRRVKRGFEAASLAVKARAEALPG